MKKQNVEFELTVSVNNANKVIQVLQ